ncbi:MAG TPA: hypothetical protein VFS58_13855 [Steroidobacteraceae bacterium]|nr:hypothetical protein [Steroidobacteraceae bacterium]
MQVVHKEPARAISPAAQHLARRAAALRRRIESLTSLKQLVALDGSSDLTADEWNSVKAPLAVLRDRLLVKLPGNGQAISAQDLRRANAQIGDLELEAARAFGLFDTFMDILTQRHSPALGPQLRGCDVLAAESLRRDTPALIACRTPIVYCNRGYGAAVVRSDARLHADIPNILPLIQIPYGRLQEKLQLTSLLHEVGHEAAGRLALLPPMRAAITTELTQHGTSSAVVELFVHWLSEIAADLWSFLASGVAHAATLREILALPAEHAFRLSMQVPHPPPYLRALLGFQLCRDTWGAGPWDAWEDQWLANYPREDCPPTTHDLFDAARAALPQVSHILLRARYKTIGGRRLAQLFDLEALAPLSLSRHAKDLAAGRGISSRLPACAHLAVFRYARDRDILSEDALDRQMKLWLYGLAGRRSSVNVVPLTRKL